MNLGSELRKTIAGLIAAIPLLALTGCESDTARIHFVLPDNYRGTFAVRVDDEKGTKVVPKNRTYTLEIPESGVLVVKRGVPFSEWHQESASYKNGAPIPNASSASGETVAYHGVTTDYANNQEVHWSLIGTEREKDRALNKRFLQPRERFEK